MLIYILQSRLIYASMCVLSVYTIHSRKIILFISTISEKEKKNLLLTSFNTICQYQQTATVHFNHKIWFITIFTYQTQFCFDIQYYNTVPIKSLDIICIHLKFEIKTQYTSNRQVIKMWLFGTAAFTITVRSSLRRSRWCLKYLLTYNNIILLCLFGVSTCLHGNFVCVVYEILIVTVWW